jgi:adenosylcobinamide-phosphate synthase
MFALLTLLALAIDAAAGYPDWLFGRIGHPVTWIGYLVGWLDRRWNSETLAPTQRRLLGIAALAMLLIISAGAGLLSQSALNAGLGALLALMVTAALASTMIAQRSLDSHVRAVADALDRDGLEAGRQAVGQIVGRDTAALDVSGVSQAAIESLAENFSDGVVAPVFWMALAGLPGALAYKAINTADSMIGHKSPRYHAFGWAAARVDDAVNLPASRLSVLFIVLAAVLVPEANPKHALHAVSRDAAKHKSPNAGWPEAAMAGALGIRLAGPRFYGGVLSETAWMGDGRAELGTHDIRKALNLYRTACGVQAAALALVMAGLVLL